MIPVKLKDATYDLGTFKAIAADVVLKQVKAASSQIIALCHNFERHMTRRQGEQGIRIAGDWDNLLSRTAHTLAGLSHHGSSIGLYYIKWMRRRPWGDRTSWTR